MSDISKKILSIDPDDGVAGSAPPRVGSETKKPDTFPAFVHRPSQTFMSEEENTKAGRWVLWTGVLLAFLWIGLSAAYLYFQPLKGADIFTPIGLTINGLVILFPGLLLLLFCIASYKLSRMSAQAAHLSDISVRLLQADQSSAYQATNLAEAIREQMNRLDQEMSTLTQRFETTRLSAQAQSKTLSETSTSLLAANETLERSLKEQRTALESMLKTAEEKFQQTEEKLDTQRNALSETLDRTALSLNEAGQKLEDKSRAFDHFISESENRLSAMTEHLSTNKEKADTIGAGLENHITLLTEKISALQTENIRLAESLENRLPLLSSLSDTALTAKEELFGVISKSVDATDALRSEAKTIGELLSEKFQTLNHELLETQKSTREIIKEGEHSGQINLERSNKALSDFETRLERLGKPSEARDTHQLPEAPSRQEAPSLQEGPTSPPNRPLSTKSVGERIHLRPLEDEVSSPYETDRSKPYDLHIEPLDLDGDMSIPPQKKVESPSLPSESDVIKPVNDPARLFGRSKPKEKSLWRWRDMMGGFDNPGDEIESGQNLTIEESIGSEGAVPSHNFQVWIEQIGIHPEQSVNDGTILDAANALATGSESIAAVLWRRIPNIAEKTSATAQEHNGLTEAAHRFRDELLETFNPEIMNRDALRNRLNTEEGKLYLLSWLF